MNPSGPREFPHTGDDFMDSSIYYVSNVEINEDEVIELDGRSIIEEDQEKDSTDLNDEEESDEDERIKFSSLNAREKTKVSCAREFTYNLLTPHGPHDPL